MICPACKGKTKIRQTFEAFRKRLCLECGLKFVTEEIVRDDGRVPIK